MIRILLADDQKLLLDSLKFLLEQEQEFEVIGTAVNGREAHELCGRLQPDVVLMDIVMPECDGVEGTWLIKDGYPDIKVLILTTFDDQKNLAAALANGADGYILKDLSSEELILAVKNVYHGFGVLHKKSYEAVVDRFKAGAAQQARVQAENREANLAERDIQIIRYIAEGKSNKDMAQLLFLGEGRVKNIVTGILRKAGAKDRAQLVVYAIRHHLV